MPKTMFKSDFYEILHEKTAAYYPLTEKKNKVICFSGLRATQLHNPTIRSKDPVRSIYD